MRTAFVQFNFEGVELSYEARYNVEPNYLVDVKAELLTVGPDHQPPTDKEKVRYRYMGAVWGDFYDALVEADAEKYPTPDRDDAVNFGKDRY